MHVKRSPEFVNILQKSPPFLIVIGIIFPIFLFSSLLISTFFLKVDSVLEFKAHRTKEGYMVIDNIPKIYRKRLENSLFLLRLYDPTHNFLTIPIVSRIAILDNHKYLRGVLIYEKNTFNNTTTIESNQGLVRSKNKVQLSLFEKLSSN